MPPLPDAIRRASPLHRLPSLPRRGRRRQPHRRVRSGATRRRDARHVRATRQGAMALPPSPARALGRAGLARRRRHAARPSGASRPPARAAEALRQGREPESDVVVQGPAVRGGGHPRRRDRRARHHDLLHRQPRRLHRRLRRARRPAVRDLHAGLGARDDEDADAGVRRRRRRRARPRSRAGTLMRQGVERLRLVSDQRLRRAAGRLESLGHRGLQDHRLRDRRGSRLDGARRGRRAERVQRRALRRSGRAGRSCRRSGS